MQQNFLSKLRKINLAVPLLLLVLCVLAYGLLIPTLGFYWDDWPYAWVNHMFGPAGYPEFVAMDRPHSAWIFMILTAILGEEPLGYHISSLLLFWVCALLFWRLLGLIWPHHPKEVLWASLLFTIYPGFLGHPQAIIYNHHFTAMALYLLSLIGMVQAIQKSEKGCFSWRSIAWHFLAVGSLVLSQFSIEYFIGWEAVRLLIAWIALRKKNLDTERRVGGLILHTLPYWSATLFFLFWRVFILRFPTYQPLGTGEEEFVLGDWFLSVVAQFNEAVFTAWTRAFPLLSSGEFGMAFWIAYLILSILTTLIVFFFLMFYLGKKPKTDVNQGSKTETFGGAALLVSLVGLIFAGWPFWLTDLTINIHSPFNSRFTMAFMPWIALFMASLFYFVNKIRGRWIRVLGYLLLAFLVGGSTGWHLWNANFYRNEWLVTQRYFQQMVHRIPDLQPGTSIVINDLRALSLYQDDSLSAIFNWTYAPEKKDKDIDYIVQYFSVRIGWEIPALEPGLPIAQSIRSLDFLGSTDQMLVVYYQPPGCLRVLDYDHPDRLPEDFPMRMIPALPLSKPSLIITETENRATPPLYLIDKKTSETWCLYFEEADLAAQQNNWERVVELGNRAFQLEDRTNEATELFIFIEGYLRTGYLDKALDVSLFLSERGAGAYDQAVCKLWQEVENEFPGGFPTTFDVGGVYAQFCGNE